LALLLVLAGGALLRFVGLGASDLWLDELFTANVARAPLGDAVATLRSDVTPPLAYAAARAGLGLEPWLGLEAALRFPSALAGALAPLVLFLAARRRGESPASALVAAAALAVACGAVTYSREARFYAIEVLLAALLVFLGEGLVLAPRARGAAAFALVAAGLVLNQTLALFFVAGETLILLVRVRRAGLLAAGLTGLLLLPWVPFFAHQADTIFVAENVRHQVTFRDLEEITRELARGDGATRDRLSIFLFLPLVFLGAAASVARRRVDLMRVALGLVLPLCIFRFVKPRQLYARYYEYLLPLALILEARGAALVARGVSAWRGPRAGRAALALLGGAVVLVQAIPLRDQLRAAPLSYSTACRALEERVGEGDRVLVVFLGGGPGEAAAEQIGFRFYAGPRLRRALANPYEVPLDSPGRTFVVVTLKKMWAVDPAASLPGARVVTSRILLVEPTAGETARGALARTRTACSHVPAIAPARVAATFEPFAR
jgi:hypothetical protein